MYPLDLKVHFLLNTAYRFTDPAQKIRSKLRQDGYFNHDSYVPKYATLSEMFAYNVSGYQIVPGQFKKSKDGKIKREECWQSQQVFMVECDSDVVETSLQEVVDRSPFVRQNAVALIESIRSGYNDPKDKTCNGELRYRIFFVSPSKISDLKAAKFFIRRILDEIPHADATGSNPTNGAVGLDGANSLILGNYIQARYIDAWRERWCIQQRNQQQTKQHRVYPNIDEIPIEYQKAISGLSFKATGWSTRMLPCLFAYHEHDGWNSTENAMGVFRHTDGNGYTFRCFKCDPPNNKRTFRVLTEPYRPRVNKPINKPINQYGRNRL